MSAEYQNTDPVQLAEHAESDLNSTRAKQGHNTGSDSTLESGIDATVEKHFAGANTTYGSAASGQGNNREIPASEGGGFNRAAGRPYKAADFADGGVGAPEARDEAFARNHGGDDRVRGNVRN
ncbi:hypothetical protein J1614_003464, partial [Plenodomus biglobosus]